MLGLPPGANRSPIQSSGTLSQAFATPPAIAPSSSDDGPRAWKRPLRMTPWRSRVRAKGRFSTVRFAGVAVLKEPPAREPHVVGPHAFDILGGRAPPRGDADATRIIEAERL